MKKTLKTLIGLLSCACMSIVAFSTAIPTKNEQASAATMSEFITTGNEPSDYAYSFMVAGDRVKYLFIEQNLLYKGKITYSFSLPCAEFYEGTTFSISVTPNEGYTLKKVMLNGVELTANSEDKYDIVIAAQDNILAVEYEGNGPQPPNPPDEDSSSSGETGDSVSSGGGIGASGCNASLPFGIGGTAVCAALSILLKKKEEER